MNPSVALRSSDGLRISLSTDPMCLIQQLLVNHRAYTCLVQKIRYQLPMLIGNRSINLVAFDINFVFIHSTALSVYITYMMQLFPD